MHEIVTLIALYAIALPLVSYGILVYTRRKDLRQLIIFSLLSAVMVVILVKLAAALHSDPRPFVRDGVKPYFASAIDNGFPSDHTVLSAALAAIVFRYHPIAGLVLFVVALLIGSARVIGGVHHGQDIVGGFAVAILGVSIAYLLTRLVLRRTATL